MKEEEKNKACLLMCYKTKRKRGEKNLPVLRVPHNKITDH
jgi:hypothetical protein